MSDSEICKLEAFDETPSAIELLKDQLARETEAYHRRSILEKVYELTDAYCQALKSGEAETVAMVQNHRQAEMVKFEQHKINVLHRTIRFGVAVVAVVTCLGMF